MPHSLVEGIQRTQQLCVQLKTCELRNSISEEILVKAVDNSAGWRPLHSRNHTIPQVTNTMAFL